MKKYHLFNLFFLAALALFSLTSIKAQNDAAAGAPNETVNGNRRADLLDELGLTAEQMQQYRRINADKRPLMRAAQQRLKQANRALDLAVYADAPDENEVQLRIKEVQTAQAEVVKIRSVTELAVRRILTAPQLIKFRDARRRFVESVEERRANKRENTRSNAPNRRFGNRRQRRAQAFPNN